jgi:hypothetical protein
MFGCYWYFGLRERIRRLLWGTGGPTHIACMQRQLYFPHQGAVAQLFHWIDERLQERLGGPNLG